MVRVAAVTISMTILWILAGCAGQAASGRSPLTDDLPNMNDDEPAVAAGGGENASEADTFADPADDLLAGTPNAEYLGTLPLAAVEAGGRSFLVWVADDFATRGRGLMFVTAEELADLPDGRGRGMLFVFQDDSTGGFWMRNTITPLDIAYIRQDGSVVNTHTMVPLDETTYPADGPYRFALEVNAGVLGELGIDSGDHIDLPEFP